MIKCAALLIFILPLISSLINGLYRNKISRNSSAYLACSAIIISAVCASYIFCELQITLESFNILFKQWVAVDGISVSWSIYIDRLSATMFLVVTIVSAVVHLYSVGYMEDDPNIQKFFCFLSLFTVFMLMLVSSSNFLQLFFGWEGVGFCSYLLIGFWYEKPSANNAALKAFIVNRISDFAFILGIILIVTYTNSLNFTEVFKQIPLLTQITFNILGSGFTLLDIICLLLFIGCMGKSAQIGFHIWLPDAMEGPTPVSALIHAATMVTAGVFLLARCSYLFEYSPHVLTFITTVGGVTAIFAAIIAVTQTDIKKIIAYSTCSQLGYMFLACGLSAYRAAIFHLVTHAFFKALLFLSAGSIIHMTHEQDITKMSGLKDKMPITYANFLAGSLAIIGIFPLAGFYSKDIILESAYGVSLIGNIVFTLGIIAAFLTAFYSVKIIILAFHRNSNITTAEAPKIMNIPLVILIAGTFCAGMIGHYILHMEKESGYLRFSVFSLHELDHTHIPIIIKILPSFIGIFGIIFGILFYLKYSTNKKNLEFITQRPFSLIYNLVKNKFYFDEMYNASIVKFTIYLSILSNFIDINIIDKIGPTGFAQVTNYMSFRAQKLQGGYIFNYAFIMLTSIICLITYFIINFILTY